MEYLFKNWDKIATRIKSEGNTLLLFDYDGTLTPIAKRPELAMLSKEAKGLLEALSYKPHFIIGIVSGRALIDIQSKVLVNGIIYVGNHGFEIKGKGMDYIHPVNDKTKLALSQIVNILSEIRGIIVENKGATMSIHYRLAKDKEIKMLKNVIHQISSDFIGDIKITHGKKVYEIRPNVNWDKEMAAKLIIEKINKNIFPIYLGDDITDEDAFKVIKGHDGISVYVGGINLKSIAQYYLNNCKEVKNFMERLLKI